MFTVGVVKVFVHAVYPLIEETPHARFAVANSTKVSGRVGIGKREVSVFSTEKALFACKGDNVFGVHHILLVF